MPKKLLIVFIAAAAIVWGIWLAFPVSAIESIIEDSVSGHGFRMNIEGLQKGLFYRLHADRIALKKTELELIVFNSVHARIHPLQIFYLRMNLSFHGGLGGGSFTGNAGLSGRTDEMHLDFKGAGLHDMRFLASAGIRGTGKVSGRISATDNMGGVEFHVEDANFEPVFVSGLLLPLNLFSTVKGSVRVDGESLEFAPISLEGPDIFARLKGTIRDNAMDMQLEVMPGRTLLGNALFLSGMEKYKVSPGYFVIPVTGPLRI